MRTANEPQLCSGHGQYHTNSPNAKDPRPYVSVTLSQIKAMAADPQSVPKESAQWVIPSTLPSRVHAEQKERGQFFALWADIDAPGDLTFRQIVDAAYLAVPGYFIAYASRSATETEQKARLIVPLAVPVPGDRYVMLQKVLNDQLEAVGITPDRATERAGQVCYLPNRGAFYDWYSADALPVMGADVWAAEIAAEHASRQAAEAAREAQHRQALAKAQERMASGSSSPVEAFNAAYDVALMLDTYGYERRGNRWLSPNSQSGSPAVQLTSDGRKWLSAHSSDAGIGRLTDNGTMGDAFDLFVHYQHGGDYNAAMRAAGDMFTTTTGETLNQANQRAHQAKQQGLAGSVFGGGLSHVPPPPADGTAWPALVSLDVTDPARLPVELWPPMLREYATAAARETETPIELPAMLALGTVAAAVQRIIDVEIKPGYVEPCCIFTAISLPPAARKSAEFKRATRPLVQWEARKREQVAEQMKQAESLLRTHQERCKELRKRASKAEDEQAQQLAQELAELEANEPQLPKPPRVFTSDVTTEHLATMMQDNGEALAVMSPEGGIFETMAGRYAQGVPNIDLYLMGHAGDPVRVDRGSKPPVMLDSPRLSVVLAVQPDVLAKLKDKPGFGGRGLLGRVLYVMPPSTLGQRTGDTPRMDSFSLAAYEDTITRLLDLAHVGNLGPWTLQLSEDARAAWRAFAQEVEAGLADGGRFEYCRDWAGKLAGAVGRIAALFHAVRGVDTFTCQPIGLEDMQAAIATGRALAEHALTAYKLMGADEAVEGAKVLIRWIQRHHLTEFTRRDAHRGHDSRWQKAEELEPAVRVLEERGYIQPYQRTPGPKGGRTSIVYVVNPAVLSG